MAARMLECDMCKDTVDQNTHNILQFKFQCGVHGRCQPCTSVFGTPSNGCDDCKMCCDKQEKGAKTKKTLLGSKLGMALNKLKIKKKKTTKKTAKFTWPSDDKSANKPCTADPATQVSNTIESTGTESNKTRTRKDIATVDESTPVSCEESPIEVTSDIHTDTSEDDAPYSDEDENIDAISYMPDDLLGSGAKMIGPPVVYTDVCLHKGTDSAKFRKTIKVPERAECIWRMQEKDKVIAGGQLSPSLTIIDPTGVRAAHNLSVGTSIISGVSISNEKQLVLVEIGLDSSNKMAGFEKANIPRSHLLSNVHRTKSEEYVQDEDSMGSFNILATINLNKSTSTDTYLCPVNTAPVSVNHCSVFTITRKRFGVYSNEPCKVDVFLLKDLLVDASPEVWNSIDLHGHTANEYDTLCVDNDENIYVCAWDDDLVHIYTQTDSGYEYSRKIGHKLESGDPPTAGGLSCPIAIQCLKDGVFVVICQKGEVHLYDSGRWRLLVHRSAATGSIWRSVCTMNYLWCIGSVEISNSRDLHVYSTK